MATQWLYDFFNWGCCLRLLDTMWQDHDSKKRKRVLHTVKRSIRTCVVLHLKKLGKILAVGTSGLLCIYNWQTMNNRTMSSMYGESLSNIGFIPLCQIWIPVKAQEKQKWNEQLLWNYQKSPLLTLSHLNYGHECLLKVPRSNYTYNIQLTWKYGFKTYWTTKKWHFIPSLLTEGNELNTTSPGNSTQIAPYLF